MASLFSQLNSTNAALNGLRADFSGLENLDKVIDGVLKRLNGSGEVQKGMQMLNNGSWSLESFDGWFAPLLKAELGKVLAIQRARAIQKAQAAGAGSASTAILRRMYKDGHRGNINIVQQNADIYLPEYRETLRKWRDGRPCPHRDTISVLLDSSGGRGIDTKLKVYPSNEKIGYAGGISPDNVEEKLTFLMSHVTMGEFWIDMESGVRTDDWFDLDKVEKVLQICEPIIKKWED